MHLSEAIRIIDSGQPVKLEVLKKDGSIMEMRNAVSVSSYVRGGIRRMKLLDSAQIREIRERLIISLNDEEIYI